MSLIDIKQHLMQVRIASLANLALYFNADPLTLRQMLGHWVRKGCVKQCLKTPGCVTTCGKCDSFTTEIYEWVM